jgi:hypothetical protein
VIPTPDLSSAAGALENLRGTVDDESLDSLKGSMQEMQRALAAGDWKAAQDAGLALQEGWKRVGGELHHEVLADPAGFVERHRAAQEGEGAPGSGLGVVT